MHARQNIVKNGGAGRWKYFFYGGWRKLVRMNVWILEGKRIVRVSGADVCAMGTAQPAGNTIVGLKSCHLQLVNG